MTPSSAAFTGVFSGTAILMPSFCWPLVVGPKAVITRPLAGQRNFGSEPVPSAVLIASFAAGVSATGVKTLALGVGSALCGGGADGGVASATTGESLGLAADVRTPGMTRRSPTLRCAVIGILLALASAPTGLPYRREILLRVSPGATTCTPGLPAGLTAATGAICGGDAGARVA